MNPYRHLTIFALIGAAVLVFVLELSGEASYVDQFGAVPELIGNAWSEVIHGQVSLVALGELSHLVTSIFLHAGPEHLLLNMVFLWVFGYLTSQIIGQWWALAAFLVCGIAGMVLQVWLDAGRDVAIVGASGAICGFEGVYLGLALRWHLPDADVWPLAQPVPPLQLGGFAILGFAADMYFLSSNEGGIAYGAHIGGFLTGLLIAAILTTVYPTAASFDQTGRRRAR